MAQIIFSDALTTRLAALVEHGYPTLNSGVVVVPQSNGMMGALLPFGEHKGFGLAVAC
jgi:LDH2 family malate/lactate/ureidoglycolate dehydrogenase